MQTKRPDISKSTILIPHEVCKWVTANRFHSPFRLYLLLNTSCSGKMKISNSDIQAIADTLGICTKTVRNNLSLLKTANWIGYNPRSKYYFIRGFEKIKNMLGLESRLVVEFPINHILNSKAFTESAIIAYLVNYQVRQDRKERRNRAERKFIRSNQATSSISLVRPMACVAISKIIGVANSKAHAMKRSGHKAKYLTVRKNYTAAPAWVNEFNIGLYRELNPETANRIKKVCGKVVTINPDLVSHEIRFKMKRKPLSVRVVQ